MKNEVKKVDSLTEEQEKIYNLTKEQALEQLKTAGISESEQMLVKWCRDSEIDAVRISKGHPKNRGLRVSSKSLEVFILSKGGNSIQLLKKIEDLETKLVQKTEENKKLKEEIKALKENGVTVPKKKTYKLENFFLYPDTVEATFKYDGAKHRVLFDVDKDEIIEILRNGRGGEKNKTNEYSQELKEQILKLRFEEMEKIAQA